MAVYLWPTVLSIWLYHLLHTSSHHRLLAIPSKTMPIDRHFKGFLTGNNYAGRSTQKYTEQGVFFRTIATPVTTANGSTMP
jgi:hypothetical protein